MYPRQAMPSYYTLRVIATIDADYAQESQLGRQRERVLEKQRNAVV